MTVYTPFTASVSVPFQIIYIYTCFLISCINAGWTQILFAIDNSECMQVHLVSCHHHCSDPSHHTQDDLLMAAEEDITFVFQNETNEQQQQTDGTSTLTH